ncbi:CLUMA_CG009897, isoform A [Clunio marinus]|uniref:CLUMA_CG009897, isoform A n=1 Tax=Clunio marinus TaxID=568069 RepID=A0A1J1I8E7_9DIPT|nr:CLUMA_CG009897, isoform A [Clunio marinus]
MKYLILVSSLCMKFAYSSFDIFNKCPDFIPINDFDFESLFGDWYTLELVQHYNGRRTLMQPNYCVTLHINGSKEMNENLRSSRYKAIEFSVNNLNEKLEVEDKFDFLFKINGSKQGLWIDGKLRKDCRISTYQYFLLQTKKKAIVQVIMIDGNFTVLTFCQRMQLTSFVLSRERDTNVTDEIEDAHYLLQRRGLFMENIETSCRASSIECLEKLTLVFLLFFAVQSNTLL